MFGTNPEIVAVELLFDKVMDDELLASKFAVVIAMEVPFGFPLLPNTTLILVL